MPDTLFPGWPRHDHRVEPDGVVARGRLLLTRTRGRRPRTFPLSSRNRRSPISGRAASRTVTPDAFERVVVGALADVSDGTPEVDCGADDIAIEDGAEVHCDVHTAGHDVVYDSVSTISTDGGDDYHVDVEVADQPKD